MRKERIKRETAMWLKYFRLFIVMVLWSALFSGCAKSPWRYEKYVHEETRNISVREVFQSPEKYSAYMVVGAFIKVAFISQHRTSSLVKGPYQLIFDPWGVRQIHRNIILNKISIRSSFENNYAVIEQNKLPLAFSFEPMDGREDSQYVGVAFESEKWFDFDFEKKELITVIVDVTVESFEGISKREQIVYEFVPKLEEGRYQWLHH